MKVFWFFFSKKNYLLATLSNLRIGIAGAGNRPISGGTT
jgi:hypothetical protein